jgi:hypothetical protein
MKMYSHTAELMSRLLDVLKSPACASSEFVINAVLNYPPSIVSIALSSMSPEKAEELLTEDLINKLLDINIPLNFANLQNMALSEDTLVKILTLSPEAIVYINPTLITHRCAQAIIGSEPEMFDELPSKFQNLDLAFSIAPEIKNFVNVPDVLLKNITRAWLEGVVKLRHEGITFYPPCTASRLFEMLTETKSASHLSTAHSTLLSMTPHVLPAFDIKDAWAAAKTDANKTILENVYGRERLIHAVNADRASKKKWISDDLGL